MKKIILAALLAVTPIAAFAQQDQRNCAPREAVTERLNERYGETRLGAGLAGDSSVVLEIWANQETGSWTITATNVNGVTCLIASGEAYQTVTEALVEGDPA